MTKLRRTRRPSEEELDQKTMALQADDNMLCSEDGEEMALDLHAEVSSPDSKTSCAFSTVMSDDGTASARIFRWALAKLVHWEGQEGRRGLLAEVKARVPGPVMMLLMRMVEAERAVAKGGAAPAARKRRLTLESQSRKRRVSFSTFDLSTVDTPDLARRDSDRPMDDVLQSLFLVLKAAEAVRSMLQQPPAADATPTHINGITALSAGVCDDAGRGKENEGHVSSSPAAFGAAAEVPCKRKSQQSPRVVLDKLVALLTELQPQAASLAASSATSAPAALVVSPASGLHEHLLDLLEDQPNWTELSNAAGLYARELRLLCLEPPSDEGMQSSRLMGRYFELLSSLIRHELKRLLNVCSCGEDGPPLSMGGLRRSDPLQRPYCSCLLIISETGNLQYNSDDPAALVHFALERVQSHKAAWRGLCEVATAPQPAAKDGEGAAAGACSSEAKEVEAPAVGMADDPSVASTATAETVREEPRWWAIGRAHGKEALSYLGAASFLLRVLREPVVEQAIDQGRWARVERLASMITSVTSGGVYHEDECFGALGNLDQLAELLEEDAKLAEELREVIQTSTVDDVMDTVPSSYGHAAGLPSHVRRKRKRTAPKLDPSLTELLTWARWDELPPTVSYPHLTPACVNAPGMDDMAIDSEMGGLI